MVYKPYLLSKRPVLDCKLVDVEEESTGICFDGHEDVGVSLLCRGPRFPTSMKEVFLRREGVEVFGMHMMLFLYYTWVVFVFQCVSRSIKFVSALQLSF